ncbi:MAG: hypothetical protein HXS48_03725 [Theionarchaea archaeon]|nr:MAG: hypothetical protein AYK19_15805 [Theionarchaea archaeon DG-70-1]MBU7026028.1 hypothetical protein [Theionarchaea archaeon]
MIEEYIKKDTLFETTLSPRRIDKDAPDIVKDMAEGAQIANVGPMAAVAGTIAEFVCRRLIRENAQVAVVENGGDIFAYTERPVTVGIFSGSNNLTNELVGDIPHLIKSDDKRIKEKVTKDNSYVL